MVAVLMAFFSIVSTGDDMTASIQQALASANAISYSTVELQPGVFPVRADLPGPLFALNHGTTLTGAGATIDASVGAVDGTRICLAVSPDQAGIVRGLTLRGPQAPGAHTTIGLQATNGSALRVESATLEGWTHAIKAESGVRVVRMQDSDVSALQQGYLAVAGTRGWHSFERCAWHDVGSTSQHHAIYMESGFDGVEITACAFADIAGYGVHRSGGGSASQRVLMRDSTWDRCGSGAILLDSGATYTAQVLSSEIRTSTGIVVRVAHAQLARVQFTCASAAIVAEGPAISVTECASDGHGLHVDAIGAGAMLTANQWIGGPGTAIRVRGSNAMLSSERFVLAGAVGVRVQDGASGLRVSDSAFYGVTGGTGAVYVDATAANPADAVLRDTIYATDYPVRAEVPGVVW